LEINGPEIVNPIVLVVFLVGSLNGG